jgi:hypothetical protein
MHDDQERFARDAYALGMLPGQPIAGYLVEVASERVRQDEKWGGADTDDEREPESWVDLIERLTGELRESLGEVKPDNFRRLLLEIAASSVAAAQAHDRLRAQVGLPPTTEEEFMLKLRRLVPGDLPPIEPLPSGIGLVAEGDEFPPLGLPDDQ